MREYRVGIIGYGWAATAHIEAINATSQGQVAAVYSSRPVDGASLSAQHGGSIKAYQNVEDLLNDPEIDVVSITSYPSQHSAQAIAAAKAKKHVILEKPMANTLEEVRAIVEAADQSGVFGCVCFECRFSSQMQATRALIDQGALGDMHYAEVDYYHGIGPWYGQFRWNTGKQDGGSALLTAGCHALDALLMCVDSPVESVSSVSTKSSSEIFAAYEYDTTSVTTLKFANGAIGKCAAVVDCLQPYYFHTHLVGSQGSLLDNKFHSEKLQTDKSRWSELSMKMLDSGEVSDHPYQAQFQAFFDSIDRNEPMEGTSFQQALKTFEVVFAADESAENGGKTIEL